jgi:hypothetical protein
MVRVTFWAIPVSATVLLTVAVSYGLHLGHLDRPQSQGPGSTALAEIRHVPPERVSPKLAGARPGFLHLAAPAREGQQPLALELSTWTDLSGKKDQVFFDGAALAFYSHGPAEGAFEIDEGGLYTITVRASGEAAQEELPRFRLSIDGQPVGADVPLTSAQVRDYELVVPLGAGRHRLALLFTNDRYAPDLYDSNLFVEGIALKRLPQAPSL